MLTITLIANGPVASGKSTALAVLSDALALSEMFEAKLIKTSSAGFEESRTFQLKVK